VGIPKKIWQAPLVRAGSLNGIGVIVKIAIGFVTSKVIAVFVGPSGMALVGNLRNFLTTLEGLGTLGLQSGMVKYVAEGKSSQTELRKVLSTIFTSVLAVVVLCSLLLFFLADYWSAWVFSGNDSFGHIFRILALSLPFYAFSIVLIAVLNGLGNYKHVIWANIIGNIISLLISVVLIVRYGLDGALFAIVISPSALFFASVFYISRTTGIFKRIHWNYFDPKLLWKLGAFSLMTLFSYVCVPLVYLEIRQQAQEISGSDAAGYWEAMTRVSANYMLFVSTLVSVYFLPKLVVSETDRQTRSIFADYLRGVVPMFFLGAIVVYSLRGFIVGLLFTEDFKPVEDLFFWQLVGDGFKSIAMIFGCCLVAKKMTKGFFITESLSLIILYATSHFMLQVDGVHGLVVAHAITYFAYCVVLIGYFRKTFTSPDVS